MSIRYGIDKIQMAIAFAEIPIGNCVCTKFEWQLRLLNLKSELAIGNCVCGYFNWQLRLHKIRMAIAFAEISIGNCVPFTVYYLKHIVHSNMRLRCLSHDAFAGSYESQLLCEFDKHDLEDILHDLDCNTFGFFGETDTPIRATLTKVGWGAIAYRISSMLDGKLVRKTAEVCRHGYEMILSRGLIQDMEELVFIHDHLSEHYKFSRHPMPIISK